jgi:GT2 family glycosyltransferase
MLGFIHGGTVRTEFMQSVMAVLSGPNASPLIGGVCDANVGPLVAIARNTLTSRFLDGHSEWLWCVDTDIIFATDTIARLMAVADPVEHPIVSALYYVNVNDQTIPAMYMAGSYEDEFSFAPPDEWDEGEVIKYDGVGAGCLLIHRDALMKIKKDHDDQPLWWREIVVGRKYVLYPGWCV